MGRGARTLRETLRSRAETDHDRLAFADDGRSLTYGELADSADELAGRLRGLGLRAGERVAIAMSAGIAWVEAFWASQLLGALPCAFNPTLPPDVVRRRAERVGARLLLSDAGEAALREPAPAPAEAALEGDGVAILQPTSGTSGEPRTAMLRHRNVLAYLDAAAAAQGITSDDVLVCWVPPWHDLGLLRFVVGGVVLGAPCHIVSPAIRTIPRWLATISDVRGTISGAPDFAYRIAASVDPRTVDLSSLRLSTNGGEPVRSTTIEAFERRFGISRVVLPGYGLAEATLGVASHRPGEKFAVDRRGNVSCGTPLAGVEIRIEPAGSGGPGEILVRGQTVFAGYLDAPEATRAALRGGWLHTGDSGYLDDDGRLYVLGRLRAMINRGGEVIAARELEEAAQQVQPVRLAAAVGITPAGARTEQAVVVVECEPGDARGPAEVADEVARAVLREAGFSPARVSVVPPRTIPRTANGKVRHGELRQAVLEGRIP